MAELANLADIGERETVALSIGNDSLRKSPTYVCDFSWVPPALREDGASSAEFFPDRWTTKSNPARSKFVPPPGPHHAKNTCPLPEPSTDRILTAACAPGIAVAPITSNKVEMAIIENLLAGVSRPMGSRPRTRHRPHESERFPGRTTLRRGYKTLTRFS